MHVTLSSRSRRGSIISHGATILLVTASLDASLAARLLLLVLRIALRSVVDCGATILLVPASLAASLAIRLLLLVLLVALRTILLVVAVIHLPLQPHMERGTDAIFVRFILCHISIQGATSARKVPDQHTRLH